MKIMGLDLSLTSTGVAVFDSASISTQVISSSHKAERRLQDLRDKIMGVVSKQKVDLCVVEGYAFGRPNVMAPMGELGGVVKLALYMDGIETLIIPPTRVKKFATGRGQAKKDEVRLSVYKRWGFEAKTNDEIDAYVLVRIGMAYAGMDNTLTKSQQEIINSVREGK